MMERAELKIIALVDLRDRLAQERRYEDSAIVNEALGLIRDLYRRVS